MNRFRLRYTLIFIIIGLIIYSAVFVNETIEEKNIRIIQLESRVIKIEKENKELSIKLTKINESKDIEITEVINKDGSSSKIRKIKTNKDNISVSVDKNESKETIEDSKQIINDISDKSKIITNEKRLRVGLGLTNKLDKDIHLSYKLNKVFGAYTNLNENKDFTIGVFIEF